MKKMHFFGLLALALVLASSLAFVGCSSGSDDGTDNVVGTTSIRAIGKYNSLPAEMIISHTAMAAGGYAIADGDYYVFRYYDGDKPGDVISRGRIAYAGSSITFKPDGGGADFNGSYSESEDSLTFTLTGWSPDANTGDLPVVGGYDFIRIVGKYNSRPAEMIISHTARASGYVIADGDYYVLRYYPGDLISQGRITYAGSSITFKPDGGGAGFSGSYSDGFLTFPGWEP